MIHPVAAVSEVNSPIAAESRRSRCAWIGLLAVIILAGATIRAREVVDRPLWEDESYTWKDSQLPYWRLVLWKYQPNQGPLGYLAVRHSTQIFGTDAPWALRMPSLMCGILCIPAAFWLGRVIHGRGLGAIAATLVAVDPNMVDQSQQARMYTMLALVWMVALGHAILLLRAPPEERRPWLVFGLLLAVLFHVNLAAVAFWTGLVLSAAILVGLKRDDLVYRRQTVRGLVTAFGLASLLSIRGIYRFIRFIAGDHEPGTTSALERFRSFWAGLEQLVGAGTIVPLAALLAVVGLLLLFRRCRTSAVVVASTGLLAAMMVYRGQSVHDVFAVRYFTTVQPALWIGLAALPMSVAWIGSRFACSIVLALFCAMQGWQCAHLDRWNDFKLWSFVRVASQFVHDSRDERDGFSCAPNVHLKTLARYYGVTDSDGADGRPVWMMAFMFDRRAEEELRAALATSTQRGAMPLDIDKTLALCKERGHVVLRVDRERIEVWEFEESENRLRMLPDAIRSELALAPSKAQPGDGRVPTIR